MVFSYRRKIEMRMNEYSYITQYTASLPTHFNPENGGIIFLQNGSTCL
jgi:hypothetical protein